MGKIAGEIANYLVITDDNPRLEDSNTIMEEIVAGITSDFQDYILIHDRKKAIEFIINESKKNDVVILLGKGHETYQILKTEVIHLDDREEAVNAILNRLQLETMPNVETMPNDPGLSNIQGSFR
ncbi:MAG: hypothetical protein D3923_09185 [Candidatus Electrothrix sp. AR3]|nr:hypothetical protein [Candidatus Electrothrix sp. AR3]